MPQSLNSRVAEFYSSITEDVKQTKENHATEIRFYESMESIIDKIINDKPLNDNEKGWVLDIIHSKVNSVRDT